MVNVEMQGLNEAVIGLTDLQKKIPSIIKNTLTNTAYDAQRNLRGWLPRLLDRPTPFTIQSTKVKDAKVSDFTAGIGLKHQQGSSKSDSVSTFVNKPAPVAMRKQVYGGPGRHHKMSEKTLTRNGLLPSGWYIVPARGAPKNQFGNVATGFMNKLLYQGIAGGSANVGGRVRVQGDRIGRAPGAKDSGRYFVLYPKGSGWNRQNPIGIYEDKGLKRPLLPIFYFRSSVSYKPRVPFESINAQYVLRSWQKHYQVAVKQEILKLKIS